MYNASRIFQEKKNAPVIFYSVSRSLWVDHVAVVGKVHEANVQFLDLLTRSGWTQARAARELGISGPTVSRYVAGQITPSRPVLRLFADRLQLGLPIYGGPAQPMGSTDGPRWLTDWEEEILSVIRRVDPDQRVRLITAFRQILEIAATGPKRPKPTLSIAERIVAEHTADVISMQDAEGPGLARPDAAAAQQPSAASSPSAKRKRGRPSNAFRGLVSSQ